MKGSVRKILKETLWVFTACFTIVHTFFVLRLLCINLSATFETNDVTGL